MALSSSPRVRAEQLFRAQMAQQGISNLSSSPRERAQQVYEQQISASYPELVSGSAAAGGTAGGTAAAPNIPGIGETTSEFLNALYAARPGMVQQQVDLLSQFGPAARQAVFAASPELAGAGQFLQNLYSDPFGGALETYQDALRSAQASRGFGGSTGAVAGEEARYLTNFAQQMRLQAVPQAMQFGQTLLGLGGLGPPESSLGFLGDVALGARQQALDYQAALRSEQMYKDYQAELEKQTQPAPLTVSQLIGGAPLISHSKGYSLGHTSAPLRTATSALTSRLY